MGRSRRKRTSTLVLVGWGLAVLALGLGLGLILGRQGCGQPRTPVKREAPKTEPRKPEKKKPEEKKEPIEKKEPEEKQEPEVKKAAEPKAKPSAEAAKPRRQEPAPSIREPGPALPRLALVIDDLGYMQPELVTRLCSLPVAFSVAVLPYQEFTQESAEIAHCKGKEVMLHLPMEPIGYPGPSRDPGPNAVLFNLRESEVRHRVRMALDEIPHRAGVNNHMGSRITPDRLRMGWVLQEIQAWGLFFLDSFTEKDSVAFAMSQELGIPTAQREVFLDDDKAFAEMEKQWERAIKLAEADESAVIIGHIYPETVAALEKLVPRSKGRVQFVTAGQLVR